MLIFVIQLKTKIMKKTEIKKIVLDTITMIIENKQTLFSDPRGGVQMGFSYLEMDKIDIYIEIVMDNLVDNYSFQDEKELNEIVLVVLIDINELLKTNNMPIYL